MPSVAAAKLEWFRFECTHDAEYAIEALSAHHRIDQILN